MGQGSSDIRDDEIDLVDLALAVWNRRWLALVTFLLITCLGIFFALRPTPVREPLLSVNTVLQVGPLSSDVATAQWLLEHKYLPRALADYESQHKGLAGELSVTVETPTDSSLVVLSANGPQSLQTSYEAVERLAVSRFTADNSDLSSYSQFHMSIRLVGSESTVVVQKNSHTRRTVFVVFSPIAGVFGALFVVMIASLVSRTRKRLLNVSKV